MHFYWRVIEELKLLGEIWIFSNPSLARNYERWISKNADAIAFLERTDNFVNTSLFNYKGVSHSLS